MLRDTYSYIWSIFIKIRNKNIRAKDIKFESSDNLSPYMELNFDEINFDELKKDGDKYIVPVNPFLRFGSTFDILMNNSYKGPKKIINIFKNLILHFMGDLDSFEGRSVRENQVEFLIRDVEKGAFGREIRNLFFSFNEAERYKIGEKLYDLYGFQEMLEAYKETVKEIFGGSIIYDNNFSKEEIVVYINSKDTEENKNKFKCINLLFLPIGLKTRIFWENHFGIIGVEKTTKIGEMTVY